KSRRHLRPGGLTTPRAGVELDDDGIDATVEATDGSEEISRERASKIAARNASEKFIDGAQGRREGCREQQSHQLERHQHRDHEHRENIEHDVAEQLLDDVGALAQMQPAELTALPLDRDGGVEVSADARAALEAIPGRQRSPQFGDVADAAEIRAVTKLPI